MIFLVMFALQQPPDTTAVRTLLTAMRGSNAVICELASQTIENGGGWGYSELRTPVDNAVRNALSVVRRGHVPPQAVGMLAAALSDEDGCVRRVAAPLLGRINTPAAVAALREALGSGNAATRAGAAVGLGYTNNHGVVPALTRLLREDRDPGVRAAAAWAIGSIEG